MLSRLLTSFECLTRHSHGVSRHSGIRLDTTVSD
nr:MAG TPA: hypothetical protein [Caudoviricetes sp.]